MENGDHIPGHDSRVGITSEEQDNIKQTRKENHGIGSASGHKRSLSGSISAFLFQRPSIQGSNHPGADNSSPTTLEVDAPPGPRPPTSAMAMAVQQQKGVRKRKGSLRKTALLGTGKLRAENKDRRTSQLEQAISVEESQANRFYSDTAVSSTPTSPVSSFDFPTPRPISSVPPPVPMVTHPIHGDPAKISAQANEIQPFPALGRAQTVGSTASTTDEEDSPTSPLSISVPSPSQKSLDSYFPPQPPRIQPPRHTAPNSRSSPLASIPPVVPSPPQSEWDYSETRWWGWTILIVTWVVFVVGMGSCLEVWSWAWDVGETPYAPPELEDDPTLPIVGYYPALIILTTVMAWVWVTIAWVGMKYFKHANISGDEE